MRSSILIITSMFMLSCAGVKVTQDQHEYVDLGLPSGTLWATCNIGATSPEDYGDYFAWGETTIKTDFRWSTLNYCGDEKGENFSKYNTLPKYGSVDNKTTLERSDDAATANWGVNWCMPTRQQFQELNDKCSWTWIVRNGKIGYEVKGPNGNTMFFPGAGCRVGTFFSNDSCGHYWSSSLDVVEPFGGSGLDFNSDDLYFDGWYWRFLGRSVRPVRSSGLKLKKNRNRKVL